MIKVETLAPKSTYVTVLPDPVVYEPKPDSIIELPDNAKPVVVPRTGVVRAIGSELLRCKVGERVMFSAYAGTPVMVGGETLLIMQDEEIIAGLDA